VKVIFVLDDQSVIVSSADELQLRQIDPYTTALAIPAGKNEEGQDLFRPFITFPVVLTMAPKPEVVATPVPPTDISTGGKRRRKAAAIQ
jgi:hypothetical protein